MGLLAYQDYRARRILEACQRLGLNVPDDVAGARLGTSLDRMEQKGDAFRARVAQSLRTLFLETGGPLRVVGALGSVDDVADQVWEAVRDLF